MNVLKDLNLIPSSIDIEPIFISYEGMVCSCLRDGSNVLGCLPDLIPLLLLHLVLEEVIKVSASLASVSSKEVQGVSVRYCASSRAGLWLTVDQLESGLVDNLFGLVVHGNITLVSAALIHSSLNLVHLVIDVAIPSCLKYLMPLLSFRVVLIHVISSAIGVRSRK